MRVCVIDGRGGGLGKRLIQGLLVHVGESHEIIALGTNEAATKTMKQAGANQSGTGEQRIKQAVPTADVILASLNLVLPGTMPTPFLAHRGTNCCCRSIVPGWKSWDPKFSRSKT